MCYSVFGRVCIKEPLLLIRESSQGSGNSGFSLLLSEWSFTLVSHYISANKMSLVHCEINISFLPSINFTINTAILSKQFVKYFKNLLYVFLFTSVFVILAQSAMKFGVFFSFFN